MSINIKEIFQSDSLSLSQEKINYNFDQILANGGGPQGLKGEKGATGAIGNIGPKGDKGDQGATGSKGDSGADGYWALKSYTNPIDQHTVLPKIQPVISGTSGAKPTNIVLGRTDSSYTEDATDKLSLITLVDENNGTDWTDLVRFRLKNGSSYGLTSGVIRLIPITGGAKLKIAAIGGANVFEIQSKDTILTDDIGNNKLRLTSAFVEASGPWNFLSSAVNLNAASSLTNAGNTTLSGATNIIGTTTSTNTVNGTTTLNNTIKIKPNGNTLAANKFLVSTDTDGTAAWRSPFEIPGIYPIGSIVFVNPADISDTYFSLSTFKHTGSPGSYDYYYFGRGIAGTRWAGWYLLFGQTNQWSTALNTNTVYVPTNIPGSLIMGAAGPDDKTGVSANVYDSSMTTKQFNPPVGYGSSYIPSIRGGYNGAGSQGVVGPGSVINPGDLINYLAGSSGYDNVTGVADTNISQDGTTQNYIYPEAATVNALPMAIYLGTAILAYNWVYKTPISSTPGSFTPFSPITP